MISPKPVKAYTDLVRGDAPCAVILAPPDASYSGIAEGLNRKISELTGQTLPVVKAGSLAGDALAALDGKNLLLLGDLSSNAVIERLYTDWYAFEDDAFPGPRGFTVRALVDPTGDGWNAVVLGGATRHEVAAAAEAFMARLEAKNGGLSFPYTFTVHFGGGEYARMLQDRAAEMATNLTRSWQAFLEDPQGETYQRRFAHQLGALAAQEQYKPGVVYVLDILDRFYRYGGLFYGVTGDPRFARAVGQATDAIYEHLEWIESHRQHSYDYRNSHYLVEPWLRGWQQVANTPWLTERQRKRGHAVMAFLATQMAVYCPSPEEYGKTRYRLLSRHEYAGVFAGNHLCRYVQRHCRLDEATARRIAEIRQGLQLPIKTMLQTYATGFDHKWQFDGGWHLLQMAMEEPYPEYVESGMARMNADFATLCINNLGDWVNFGARNVNNREGYDAWQILGRAELLFRDGTFQWWLTHRMKDRLPRKILIMGMPWWAHWYRTRFESKVPVHLIGVNRAPVPKLRYEDLQAGRERLDGGNPVLNDVSYDETFNKISLRDGLATEDQYLLLDGVGGTVYSANDAGEIADYSACGQELLVACEEREIPFYRNTVSASRGNAGDPAGVFARLRHTADAGPLLYTELEVAPQSGTRHVRRIFMEKGGFVLVVDDITVQEADEYALACTFRGLGTPELRLPAGKWTLRNSKADLHLVNVSVPGLSPKPTFSESVLSSGPTPAAQSLKVKVYRATAARRFEAGETYRFAHLFHGVPHGEAARFHASAIDPNVIAAGDTALPPLFGAPPEGHAKLGALAIEATAFRISLEDAVFVAARSITLNGASVFKSDTPCTIHVDLANGKASVESSRQENVGSIRWKPLWRKEGDVAEFNGTWRAPDGQSVQADLTRMDSAALKSVVGWAVMAVRANPVIGILDANRLPETRGAVTGHISHPVTEAKPYDIDHDGRSDILCACRDGHVTAMTQDGETLFDVKAGQPPVLTVWAGELWGQRVVLSGSYDGRVHCFDPSGKLLWEYKYTHPSWAHRSMVYDIAVGDFDGSSKQRIALGCHFRVAVLDENRQLLRDTSAYAHKVKPILPVRLFGEPMERLLVNTWMHRLFIMDPLRGELSDGWTPHFWDTAAYLGVHQFEGNDAFIVHGGPNGLSCGRLLRDAWMKGQRKPEAIWGADSWHHFTDGAVRSVLVHDFDGDGEEEIVCAVEAGFLVAYDPTGKRLWKRLIGSAPSHMLLLHGDDPDKRELVVAGASPNLTVYDAEWKPVRQGIKGVGGNMDYLWNLDGTVIALTKRSDICRIEWP